MPLVLYPKLIFCIIVGQQWLVAGTEYSVVALQGNSNMYFSVSTFKFKWETEIDSNSN